MRKKPTRSAPMEISVSSRIPSWSAVDDLFGPPPLIPGEEKKDYEALLTRVTDAVLPADHIEQILVRDVVNLVWEALRLRRLKAKFLEAVEYEGLGEILKIIEPPKPPTDNGAFTFIPLSTPVAREIPLATRWARREPAALKKVDRYLAAAGLTMDSVRARTFILKLDEMERIDRMIASCEARRNAAFREIDRHRGEHAERLRRAAAQEIEDAQYKVTDATESEGES
jgi:hypothetical protein